MTERALLSALVRHRLPIEPARPGGHGYLIRRRARPPEGGALLFWTPDAIRDRAVAEGWVDSTGRITSMGRSAIGDGG